MTASNPLLQAWTTPHGLPPFSAIRTEHFLPAAEAAMAAHRDEILAIAANPAQPDFANTVAAFEASGALLQRLSLVFENLTGPATSPELQAVELELNPKRAAHHSAIYLDAALFARIDAVHRERQSLGLDAESLRLVERIHLDFVLAGAQLSGNARERFGEIVARLASLYARFSQNVLADEARFVIALSDEQDLAGLPGYLIEAARDAARERGQEGWIITLSRSLVVPFLSFSSRRDLRQRAYEAWRSRGEHEGEHDNRPLISEILSLRKEQAALLGYANYAQFALVDTMAGTPAAVRGLLDQVWPAARERAGQEEAELRTLAVELGEPADIQAWDWRYLSEKLRQRKYALDDAELKPYFALESVRGALFDCAQRLFGVEMRECPELPAYHPDVRSFEVRREGALIGIFQADDFSRPTKQGGAWMSELRVQCRTHGDVIPLVLNNNNFNRGNPTLLSFDDVRTMFHEFGHGLHSLLSNVHYARLAGPNVLGDFVELPSQLMENWALEPEVLKRHARHVASGEPIPDTLIDKILASKHFNQGFDTVEYLSSTLVDLALHEVEDPATLDLAAFEQAELARIGAPAHIGMRHRLPHFGHMFSASYYASRYYVYMWAEVLDADGFNAFKEAGDLFDPATAGRLHRNIYSVGNSIEPGAAYRAFRGRDAAVAPLLRARGLLPA